jgi:GNAT superfamily N-acetyltransferase
VSVDDTVIRPVTLADTVGHRECLQEVMGERRWLAFVEPFSLADSAAFVARNISAGNPHFVVAHGEDIVGWCDICRQIAPVYAHDATMGMGLRQDYRRRGLGERLLRTSLDAAPSGTEARFTIGVR